LDFFLNWPIPAETSSKSFWNSDMTSKNDILASNLTFFHQKSFCRPPRFWPVLLLLQTTRAREKSYWAMVRSAVRRQSTFHLVPVPRLCRLGGKAGYQSGRSLFLSQCSNVAEPFGMDYRNRSALLRTPPPPMQGEVTLHLVKARSELNGLR
jgi:hypothetical protein